MKLKLFCTPLRQIFYFKIESHNIKFSKYISKISIFDFKIENHNITFSKYISKINILQEAFDSSFIEF
jgi:hypothetical protein